MQGERRHRDHADESLGLCHELEHKLAMGNGVLMAALPYFSSVDRGKFVYGRSLVTTKMK